MNRVEDLINSAKTNELLGELLHIKKEEEKKSNVLMWVAITLGAVLAVAGIAYAVYRFFTPDYLEDFDEDFDDDYDDYDDDEEDDEDDEDDDEDEEEEEERPRRKKGKSKDWQSRNFLDDDDLEFEFLDLK